MRRLVPQGETGEDGVIPDRYPLRETASRDYRQRTRMNVIDADATLIFAMGQPSGGTALTIGIARRNGKPLRLVDLRQPPSPQDVAQWLDDDDIETLNVAGPRESECPGIYAKGKGFLLQVFETEESNGRLYLGGMTGP